MSLSLPADIEPYLTDGVEWSDGGCYALSVDGPHSDWSDHWDTKPPWWGRAVEQSCIYVGATNDVLSRLEDHRNGDVRQAAFLQVCDINDLIHVEWHDNPFEYEHRCGLQLKKRYPDRYVHWR